MQGDGSGGARRVLGPLSAVVALVALAKLLLHLATTGRFGYGFFVDELYFLACSEHLAWGFVDLPPLFPALTAAVRATLGDSLAAVRLVPALAGAALVLLTGLLAREMGGGRGAQGLSALAVVVAPFFLIDHSLHTMNALEPLLVAGCLWVVVRLANGGSPRWWLLFGLLTGLGLLNKHSMALFAAAAVLGVLASRERSTLATPWPWLGGALAFALFLPNLVWEVGHSFPHLEQLANIRADGRDVELTAAQFLAQQLFLFHPLAAPLWIGGVAWLLAGREGRRYRAAGVFFGAVLVLLIVLHGRVYYAAPAYPPVLAAGAVALERGVSALTARWPRARFTVTAYALVLLAAGAALAPAALPCLPPEAYVRYARALGIDQPRIENHHLGPLPQLFADRFGWPEMAAEVARVYRALPPEERAKAAVFGQNYGQAGAIDLFGPALGLPKALSGHLTYWYWGPRGHSGEVMIVLDDDRETLETLFESVELAGRVGHPYSMPYQHFDVWVCRGLRVPLEALWPRLKQFD